MTDTRIAIIGAGMAGLACARMLAVAGMMPVILDKGRGIGGRLATRRAPEGRQFDHGAQYVTAKDPGFAALLTDQGIEVEMLVGETASGKNLVDARTGEIRRVVEWLHVLDTET